MTTKIIYNEALRTSCTHIESGTVIETDAPKDNQGKGERFSPTDLVATALGSCMISIIGITGRTHEINIDGTVVEVVKIMSSNPRRIDEIKVLFHFPKNITYNEKQKQIIKHSAMNCPVLLSLHPEIKKTVDFNL